MRTCSLVVPMFLGYSTCALFRKTGTFCSLVCPQQLHALMCYRQYLPLSLSISYYDKVISLITVLRVGQIPGCVFIGRVKSTCPHILSVMDVMLKYVAQ